MLTTGNAGGTAEANYDTSVAYTDYGGTLTNMLTTTELIAEMSNGNNDLTEVLSGETGATNSALNEWVTALQLVYGRVTSPTTQNNTANDGNVDASLTINSKEYDGQ